jgi:hypothetical protein
MNAARPCRGASSNDLAVDPELAAIALLDAALALSVEALLAFVPELDPQARTWSEAPPVVLAARQIVVHARHLRQLIHDYRDRLDCLRAQAEGGIPF